MSWEEGKSQLKKEIAERVTKITALNADGLARTDEFGQRLSYASGIPLFKSVVDFFHRFGQVDLSFLSHDLLNQVHNACVEIDSRFEQIQTTDLTQQGNPAAVRDSHIADLDNAFGRHVVLLSSLLAASGHESLSLRQKEETADQLITDIRRLKTDSQKEVAEIQTSVRETLAEVQRAAASAGVATHAVHFDTEAKRYEESSEKWLRRTVKLAIAAFVLTVVIALHSLTAAPEVGQSIQIAVSKIAVLAVVYSSMFWSARIYRSERHNWTVNRHRRNALLSFETFVAASTDDSTKSAVLLQATESIFGHQPSGFSEKGQDVGNPKILEVFRGLAGGGQD